MDWHVNEGLAVLIGQVRAKFPGIEIGTIGDAAHRAEKSDHNPNKYGRVNAADFMLGSSFNPSDAFDLSRELIRDSRTHYVIWNHDIWTSETRVWKDYSGTDPHNRHIHLSVHDLAYTNTHPWVITEGDDVNVDDLVKNHNGPGKAPDTTLGKLALSQQAVDGIDGELKMYYVAFQNLGKVLKSIDEKLDRILAKQ